MARLPNQDEKFVSPSPRKLADRIQHTPGRVTTVVGTMLVLIVALGSLGFLMKIIGHFTVSWPANWLLVVAALFGPVAVLIVLGVLVWSFRNGTENSGPPKS